MYLADEKVVTQMQTHVGHADYSRKIRCGV
jgi:hypothetical protein